MKLMQKEVAHKFFMVTEGGKPYVFIEADDPLEVFFELMEVVEAQYPVWLEREPSVGHVFCL